jgi:hypothetical protein
MSNPNYKIRRTLSGGNTKKYSHRSPLQEPVQKMSKCLEMSGSLRRRCPIGDLTIHPPKVFPIARANPNYKIHRTLSGIETPKKYPYFGQTKNNHRLPDAVLTKYGKRFMFSSIVLSAIIVYNGRDRIFNI